MKIVLNSYTGIGAWFILRLLEEGHSVDYHWIGKKDSGEHCLDGLVPVPIMGDIDYGKYDLSIFDLTGKPKQAEQSLQFTPTIGDSKLASQLEEDRLFGIEIMEQSGINVPPYEVFDDINKARQFVSKTKKRYVFKPNGGQDQSAFTTYVSSSYEDLLEYFEKLTEAAKGEEFLLQEFVSGGTEISTEAYFNGNDFYCVNATLEEKKFMDGNIGPNTGCAGNLVWAYSQMPKVFKEGLEKLGDYLYVTGYRGMVDLNTIVTEGELYGLEWTPRFGYDASATLFALLRQGTFGEFLHAVASGERPPADLINTAHFSAGVRVSIPPYPSEVKGKHPQGIPIGSVDPEEIDNIYLWDVMLEGDNLVSCGEGYGCICVPIYTGESPLEAFNKVYSRIKKLKIPDSQYRTDLCKYTMKRYEELQRMGWL